MSDNNKDNGVSIITIICLIVLSAFFGVCLFNAQMQIREMQNNYAARMRDIQDDTGAIIKFEYHKEQDQLYIWTEYSWGTTNGVWDRNTALNGSIVTSTNDGMTMIMSIILNEKPIFNDSPE